MLDKDDLFDNIWDYLKILLFGFQIGLFIGGCYHLMVTGSVITTIVFWTIGLLYSFLY